MLSKELILLFQNFSCQLINTNQDNLKRKENDWKLNNLEIKGAETIFRVPGIKRSPPSDNFAIQYF